MWYGGTRRTMTSERIKSEIEWLESIVIDACNNELGLSHIATYHVKVLKHPHHGCKSLWLSFLFNNIEFWPLILIFLVDLRKGECKLEHMYIRAKLHSFRTFTETFSCLMNYRLIHVSLAYLPRLETQQSI